MGAEKNVTLPGEAIFSDAFAPDVTVLSPSNGLDKPAKKPKCVKDRIMGVSQRIALFSLESAKTTRLRRPQACALVSCAACVHRIPPRVRDDRDTPL